MNDEIANMYKKLKIPTPTIERLPLYFQCLSMLRENDVTIVSSEEVAARTGLKASQFRKDLSYFGEFGIQGLGYPVIHLLDRIATIMQLNRKHNMALFGVGNLGRALLHYPGFVKWGFRIKHIFDNDPEKIGKDFRGIVVQDIAKLPYDIGVEIGILTVPPNVAQEIAHLMVKSGIKAILNFTGVKLMAKEDIIVRDVDLTNELAILAYQMHTKSSVASFT